MEKRTRRGSHTQSSKSTDPTRGSSNYQDRPADEGKHGDATEEPTAAPLGNGTQRRGTRRGTSR